MPQWQGGDHSSYAGEIYPVGARLLAFLAPESEAPLVEVPVEPYTGATPSKQNGILWQETLLRQIRAARNIIDAHNPDRIIMFGGDCLVNQAPFSYLNERYGGKLGLLWIDAHPDITTPKNMDRAHAMVLGDLLGGGDPILAKEVKVPFRPDQVLLIGVDEVLPHEAETIREFGLRTVPSKDMAANSDEVVKWIRDNRFEHVAIHVDLDVLDPKFFYSQLLRNPDTEPFETFAGKVTIAQLTRLIKDVSEASNVVGIGFTEHMPWDALNLKNMMQAFSFMK